MSSSASSATRCAVVTGASQGVGRAVALDLAVAGYKVWAVARRAEALAELVDSGHRGEVIPAACDLTDAAATAELVSEVASRTPQVSALVHSAGVMVRGRIEAAPAADFTRAFRANVESAYVLTQLLLPYVTPAGSVIFLNSSQGIHAAAETSQYAACMHARRALADSLRAEVNSRRIRVASLYLGRTATPRQAEIYASNNWTYRPELLLQPHDIATVIRGLLELPDTAEVTDLHIRPAIKSY